MPALSEMTDAEKQMADDDPDLLEVLSLTEDIRGNELLRAYKLRRKLENSSRQIHEEILDWWSLRTGRSKGAWLSDLKWANAIDPDDLLEVFAEEDIPQREWVQRVGTSHLRVIARAKFQDEDLPLTSRERAEWVNRAYHRNLSVEALEQALRDNDLLPPKRGTKSKPIPQGKPTACTLLEALAAQLKANGQDFELDIPQEALSKPMKVWKALWRLSERYGEMYPKAEFKIAEEAKTP